MGALVDEYKLNRREFIRSAARAGRRTSSSTTRTTGPSGEAELGIGIHHSPRAPFFRFDRDRGAMKPATMPTGKQSISTCRTGQSDPQDFRTKTRGMMAAKPVARPILSGPR